MSILTKAIDESRKRTREQEGAGPSPANTGRANGGSTPLTRAIDQSRTAAPVQAGSGVSLPTARQGMGVLPKADQGGGSGGASVPSALPGFAGGVPEWAEKPSFSPLPGARSARRVQDEIDQVDTAIQTLRKKRDALNAQAQQVSSRGGPWERMGGPSSGGYQQTLRQQALELDKEISRLERDKTGLREEWGRADEREFERLRQTPEYQTAVEKALSPPSGFFGTVQSLNPAHRDVRSAISYFQHKAQGDEQQARQSLLNANMALDRMDDKQRDRLAYYVGMGNYDGAADYLRRVMPGLNREQAERLEQGLSAWSQEHPALGAAVNTVSWPLNIPAYFDNARQAAENAITGEDRRSTSMTAATGPKFGAGTAQGVSEAARSAAAQATGSELAGDAAAFLAGTGLSIGQNATQIALLGPASLAGMAMSAAGGSTAEALERGATPGQALALGTASGAIEALTEKLPLENLFRLAKEGGGEGARAAVREVLKQMGTEATEEMVSEIANSLVDAAVMGESSEFQSLVRELQAQGLSREAAERKALQQFGLNVLLAGLGGAISGGVMSGGAMAVNRAGAHLEQRRTAGAAQEGVTLPRGSEDATLPTAQDAAAPAAQEAVRNESRADQVMFVEQALREAYERGELSQADYQAAVEHAHEVQRAQEAAQAPQTAQEAAQTPQRDITLQTAQDAAQAPQRAQDSAAGEGTDAQAQNMERLKEMARQLAEDYRQGRVSEEEFDRTMELLQEQAELTGMEMSAAMELIDAQMGGEPARMEGGQADEAERFGDQLFDGDGGRPADPGAGGAAGSLGKGGPQSAADPGRAAAERSAAGQYLREERVSSKRLGIRAGTDAKTLQIMPGHTWDREMRDAAARVRSSTGQRACFVLGGIEITGTDGRARQVRGVYNPGLSEIIIQADNRLATPGQIADHEIFHDLARQDPGLLQAAEDAIVERFSREEFDRVTEQYIQALRGIMDVPEADAAGYAQALEGVKNEVLADAYAGINAFGTETAQYRETVRETAEGRAAERGRGQENAQATDRRTGPPDERFSFAGRTEDGIEVYETSEEIRRLPYKQRVAAFLDIMRGEYRGRTARFTTGDGEVYYAKFNETDLRKNVYGDRRSSRQGLVAKVNVGADGDIFSLIEDGEHSGSKMESGKPTKAHKGVTGWEYFVKTVQIDGQVYDLLANVRKKPDGEYVYSIQLNESKSKAPAPSLAPAYTGENTPDGYTQNRMLTGAFDEAPAPSLASSHSMNGDAQDRMLTGASGESIAQGDFPVKPWDGTLPRGTDGELTLPGGNFGEQERYSANIPDGLTLPTLAESQARKSQKDGSGGDAAQSGETVSRVVDELPGKARNYLRRTEQRLTDRVGELLGVPRSARRESLQDIVRGISAEYLSTGQVSQETRDALFERAYEQGAGERRGPGAEEFKRQARRDFDEAVADAVSDLRQVKRYAEERAEPRQPVQLPTTTQEAEALYGRMKGARRTYQKTAAKNLLTQHDEIQVGRLLRGELELEQLDPEKDNVKGITAVYESKLEYEELANAIREWNKQRKAQLREQADGFLESASQWKDKKAGILYARETMERNIRDIVPDQKLADRINQTYFQPVHQAAAEANRMKNTYRDRVRALKLSRKAAKGDAVSEAHAVQLLGEAEDNIRMLEQSRGMTKEREGKTVQEWQAVIAGLWENSPSLDQDKIRGAVKEFRAIYDELFQQMNETRVRNGYEPVNYRQGYFPHFQADSENLMAQFGRALGIETAVTNLPTTINGLTHTFKPGIQWFGNALERKGFETAYDAVQGFDRYIEGAADVIHQTDNIQRLRALAAQIRDRTTHDEVKLQIEKVRENSELSPEDKLEQIKELREKGQFALSRFVVELDEYTNLLANKKSRSDRDMEHDWSRRIYNFMKWIEGRAAANMVTVNPASWLTNFAALTQGWGAVKSRFMLEGMWDTLKAVKADDGMVGMSSFLTNRRGSDPIVRTWTQSASSLLSAPMEFIDSFTADSLVRARFKQNRAAGLSETAAVEEADAWAAGVMADRSKGATPTLFNRKNPWTKLFTQFQLEVNNQLSYLFKDLPRDVGRKGLAALCAALLKFFLGAYVYNEVYEYFVGRRCALDPIGILNDTVGDFTGYELPNLIEMAVDAAQGKEISFQTEKKSALDAATGLARNVAEELPFVGGALGGGRFPASSAMPDFENLGKAVFNNQWDGKKRVATAVKAVSGPATYLVLPFGGGQVKKVFQALKAVREGGSYTVDSEGNDILQYPVFNDSPLTLPTALAFGKSSLPTAREWAESGFKSFSAKQTACYQGMTELGVPQRDAYQLLQELGDVEAPTGEDVPATEKAAYQKRKLLQEAEVSDQGKAVVYYNLLASDRERELMDSLNEGGTDMGEAARVLMEIKDAGAEMENNGLPKEEAKELALKRSAEKKKSIMDSSLSEEEKDKVFGYMLGKDSPGAAWSSEFVKAGLDGRSAAAVANAINGLVPEEGKKTVSDAQKWRAVLDTANGTADQKAALLTVMNESSRMRYEIADSHGIRPEAWVLVKEALPQFDENGNGSYSSGEIENAIDALAGDGRLLSTWGKRPIRLNREEKAVLWQLFTGSTSGGGNPYSMQVGRKVAGELKKAREEAEEKKR